MIHWIKQGPGSILSYTFQTISRTGFEFASTCTLTAEERENTNPIRSTPSKTQAGKLQHTSTKNNSTVGQ